MEYPEKPSLSLREIATITDELHDIDTDLWEILREFLMPIGLEDLPLAGPRPPRLAAKFYFVLGNYSIEAFRSEANLYRRFPPNPHYSKWLLDLAQRVENHAIDVVHDIESSSSKDFSYHRVSEEEMREAIWSVLSEHMRDHYQADVPTGPPPSPYNYPKLLGSTMPHSIEEEEQPIDSPPTKTTKGTIYAPKSVEKLDAYLAKTQMGFTEFAAKAGTSDKTLRSFRQTGRVRRYIFDGIARAMGLSRDELLDD
jgi:hypothetical protein